MLCFFEKKALISVLVSLLESDHDKKLPDPEIMYWTNDLLYAYLRYLEIIRMDGLLSIEQIYSRKSDGDGMDTFRRLPLRKQGEIYGVHGLMDGHT